MSRIGAEKTFSLVVVVDEADDIRVGQRLNVFIDVQNQTRPVPSQVLNKSLVGLAPESFARRPLCLSDLGIEVAGKVIGGQIPRCRPDRKSTRLNSSHVSISYAVL